MTRLVSLLKGPGCLREDIVKCISYDPETGALTWLVNRGPARAGQPCGTRHKRGQVGVWFNGTAYYAHRIAWLIYYGEWPSGILDHVNGDPQDNRISNLRLCTHSQNMGNRRRNINNVCGVKGVSFHGGKWRAVIHKDKKRIILGRFENLEEAGRAYELAAKTLFGEFARSK